MIKKHISKLKEKKDPAPILSARLQQEEQGQKYRQPEAQLHLLSSMVKQSSEGMAVADPEGRLLFVNESFAAMHGYTSSELRGKHLSIFHTPEQLPSVNEANQKTIETGFFSGEIWHVRKDGYTFPTWMHNSLLKDETGRIIGLIGTLRDISQLKKMEENLKKERDLAQTYFDIAGVMMVVIKADQRVSLINQKGCEILEYQPEEIIGQNWFDNFIPPQIKNTVKQAFAMLMAGEMKEIEYFENPILTKSGQEKIIAWHNTILKDEQGKTIGSISSGEDITERKRAMAELKYRGDFARLVSDISTQLISVPMEEIDNSINGALPKIADFTGTDAVAVYQFSTDWKTLFITHLWHNDRVIISKEIKQGFEAASMPWTVERLKRNEPIVMPSVDDLPQEATMEKRVTKAQGVRSMVEVPIIYQGLVTGFMGLASHQEHHKAWSSNEIDLLRILGQIFSNTLMRKKAFETLKQSAGRLKEAERIAGVGHWELDLILNQLYWSDETYRIFGLKPREFGKTYQALLEMVHPKDRDLMDRAYTDSVRNKTFYHMEHRILLKDGTIKWVHQRCRTKYDEQGIPILSLGTILDITERKRREEELKKYRDHLEDLVKERTRQLEEKTQELSQANTRLKELDHLKSMFIASMSHELRTPLNSIIGFTGIILMGLTGEINEEQRKQLTMARKSADHLLTLINDVIDVSKIEAGKFKPSVTIFDLAALIREVKDIFSLTATEKGLPIILYIPEKLSLASDERRVKQVLVNLVGNALKFTYTGKIEIYLSCEKQLVQVSVKDTGPGIKKEDMDKLFKAFSRITPKGEALKEGTGLGLYLSQKIVELLGGRLWAESEPDQGSTFYFTLPLSIKDCLKG